MSNFWEKVDAELNYRGMPRKELAKKANFPDSYISKGIARKSIPSADLALRIAHALNVSLEYLLEMDVCVSDSVETERELKLFHKYSSLIDVLESASQKDIEILKDFFIKLDSTR